MSSDAAPLGADDELSSASSDVAQARRTVLPWADLNALDPPLRWSQIAPDLLSALAVMVAQGVDRPRLLGVDATGALKVGSRINAVTTLGASLPANATVATVLDTSQFFPGDHVSLVKNGAPQSVCVDVIVKSVDSPTQMTFVATCSSLSFGVGDFVIGEQTVQVRNVFNPVPIAGKSVLTAIGVVNPLDNEVMMTDTINGHQRLAVDPVRSVDWQKQVVNVTPGAASVTQAAAGVGFKLVVKDLFWTVDNRSGAAFIVSLRVWNGASGVGTPIFFTTMNVPANSVEKLFVPNMQLRADDNTQLVADYSGGAASVNESVIMTGYVEG